MVAERLGHPADTALTLGRAVAGSAAREKARNIGREEREADRDADKPGMCQGALTDTRTFNHHQIVAPPSGIALSSHRAVA